MSYYEIDDKPLGWAEHVNVRGISGTYDQAQQRVSFDFGAGGGGGGPVPGAPRLYAIPFAYNTPNLLTGAVMYTPTVGDILLDAWIEMITPWDGTSPKGDWGNFVGTTKGLNQQINCDTEDVWDMSESPGTIISYRLHSEIYYLAWGSSVVGSSIVVNPIALTGAYAFVPTKFTSVDPIKVVVSQGGEIGGADSGSTQGAAILYLLIVTPITP